ncbi:MAG TPA: PP2C family protein-serine/threonine phosphatase [Trebonia sp.]|nr:PP2C family protein-serine/threonine phosphatase [Trebonia sp.]
MRLARAPAVPRAPRVPRARGNFGRWRDRWLELILAAAVIAVVVVCLDRIWTAPLLLDPLLAVPPALAGIGAATIWRPLAYGAAAGAAAAIVAVTASGGARDLPEATLVAVALATIVSVVGAALGRRALTARLTASLTSSLRASIDSSTRQQLANAVSVAEVAQRAVLRPLPEAVGNLRFGVVYLAAAADAKVGGDLYDVANTPYGVRVIIGDVRGKGLGAVEVAADVLGMYREIAHGVHTLGELARRLDAGLARRYGEHEEFVTALLAEIDPSKGRLTLFNCGHPPAMLIEAATGDVRVLEVPGNAPPLGLITLGDHSGASMVVDLRPNDQLLLYTDGVTEARGADRAFYPLQERLTKLATAARHAGETGKAGAARPIGEADGDLLGLLRADLLRHVGAPLDDDAALLLVRAPAAWPRPVRAGIRAVAR